MTRKTLFALLIAAVLPAAHAEDVVRTAPSGPRVAAKPGPVAAAVTDAEVGDADSFGRGVRWLGLVSGYVRLSADCTGDGSDTSPCATVASPTALTPFDFPDLDTLTLRARASESILCHAQTPVTAYVAANPGPSAQEFEFRVTPYYVVESDVLVGTNPQTGAPFGGRLELPLTGIFTSRTMQPGDTAQDIVTGTRACIGGLVTRASLVDTWGLSEAQAARFFRRPVTITLGIRGHGRLVEDAQINIGTRFYGD